jgi:hypothetical protein
MRVLYEKAWVRIVDILMAHEYIGLCPCGHSGEFIDKEANTSLDESRYAELFIVLFVNIRTEIFIIFNIVIRL